MIANIFFGEDSVSIVLSDFLRAFCIFVASFIFFDALMFFSVEIATDVCARFTWGFVAFLV